MGSNFQYFTIYSRVLSDQFAQACNSNTKEEDDAYDHTQQLSSSSEIVGTNASNKLKTGLNFPAVTTDPPTKKTKFTYLIRLLQNKRENFELYVI